MFGRDVEGRWWLYTTLQDFLTPSRRVVERRTATGAIRSCLMVLVKNALVVGGGIGGLTAAVALRQRGIDTDLIEVNPEFSVYGVGIIQPNNVLRALDEIGLARRCVELGSAFPGWRIFDSA